MWWLNKNSNFDYKCRAIDDRVAKFEVSSPSSEELRSMLSTLDMSEPLLGSSKPLSVALVGDEEMAVGLIGSNSDCRGSSQDDERHDVDSIHTCVSCMESLVAGIVLPGLLWMNFCLALGANHESAAAAGLPIWAVHLAFSLFLVAVTLYRKMSDEFQFQSVLAILLPEVTMTVVLAFVLRGEIANALASLLVGTLFLSILGVAISLLWLLSNRRDNERCG